MEREVTHNSIFNPTSLIVWQDTGEGQGEEVAGTIEHAPEDLEDKEFVILWVEEAPSDEPEYHPSFGRNQNPRLVNYNGAHPSHQYPLLPCCLIPK